MYSRGILSCPWHSTSRSEGLRGESSGQLAEQRVSESEVPALIVTAVAVVAHVACAPEFLGNAPGREGWRNLNSLAVPDIILPNFYWPKYRR